MSRMSISGFISSFDTVIFGFGMRNGSHYPFGSQVAGKFQSTRQLRRWIPALDTICFIQQWSIFFFIRIFHLTGKLPTCHLRIQVRPFHMKSQYRTVFFFHQLFAYTYSFTNLWKRRRWQCRENTGGTVSLMCFDSCAECLFRTLCKIVTTAPMSVHTYKSGDNIHAFGINQIGANQR